MRREIFGLLMSTTVFLGACDSVSDSDDATEAQNGECTSDSDCTSGYCTLHECVPGVACRSSGVSCEEAAPNCAVGEVPSVQDGCWGPCVAASSCSAVDDCSSCANEDLCIMIDYEISVNGPYSIFQCTTNSVNCDEMDWDCVNELDICSIGVFLQFKDNIVRCGVGGMYEPTD